MAQILYGDRIGATGRLRVGCTAAIFDSTGQALLLTKRSDNGLWCLPGGAMEAGESVTECVRRECREEIGVEIEVLELIGIYSSPHRLTLYNDGNRVQFVALTFGARLLSDAITLDHESTDWGWFTAAEIGTLEILGSQQERMADIFAATPRPHIR